MSGSWIMAGQELTRMTWWACGHDFLQRKSLVLPKLSYWTSRSYFISCSPTTPSLLPGRITAGQRCSCSESVTSAYPGNCLKGSLFVVVGLSLMCVSTWSDTHPPSSVLPGLPAPSLTCLVSCMHPGWHHQNSSIVTTTSNTEQPTHSIASYDYNK